MAYIVLEGVKEWSRDFNFKTLIRLKRLKKYDNNGNYGINHILEVELNFQERLLTVIKWAGFGHLNK